MENHNLTSIPWEGAAEWLCEKLYHEDRRIQAKMQEFNERFRYPDGFPIPAVEREAMDRWFISFADTVHEVLAERRKSSTSRKHLHSSVVRQ